MYRARLVSCFVALAAGTEVTAQTIYNNSQQAAFNAVVAPGSYFETFSASRAPGGALSLDYSGGTGPFNYTATAGGGGSVYSQGIFLGNFNSLQSLTLTYTGAAVRSIGGNFYISDLNDVFVSAPVTITYNYGSSSTVDTFTPASINDFRGFSLPVGSPPITSLVMSAQAANFNSLDNLTVGNVTPVPEPGWLILCGIAFTAGISRVTQRIRNRAI